LWFGGGGESVGGKDSSAMFLVWETGGEVSKNGLHTKWGGMTLGEEKGGPV